jgi:hypothetical protein
MLFHSDSCSRDKEYYFICQILYLYPLTKAAFRSHFLLVSVILIIMALALAVVIVIVVVVIVV